jgi:hypothetical protein
LNWYLSPGYNGPIHIDHSSLQNRIGLEVHARIRTNLEHKDKRQQPNQKKALGSGAS